MSIRKFETVKDTFVTVWKGHAHGKVRIPTSKSIAHRALICAALADKPSLSVISRVPYNEDIDATLDCLEALGVHFRQIDEFETHTRKVIIEGMGGHWLNGDRGGGILRCRESGSTMRFMLPLCLLTDSGRTLTGSPRLLQRPLDDYRELFSNRSWIRGEISLDIGWGTAVTGGEFHLEGKTSSQFVTGLLFILPILHEDSTIVLSQAPESRSYIDMTIAVMKNFGVTVYWENETTIKVPGGQIYSPAEIVVDGDASGAAFFHALNAVGGHVDIVNVSAEDDIFQGDSVCPQLLDKIRKRDNDAIPVISLADCPDLGPILFAVAALEKGTLFTHTDRLRLKESDRVAAMAAELAKFGAVVVTSDEPQCDVAPEIRALLPHNPNNLDENDGCGGWVFITAPKNGLHPAKEVLLGHNDHRIVMSLAVLASVVGKATIDHAAAVNKSFPNFYQCLQELGLEIDAFGW